MKDTDSNIQTDNAPVSAAPPATKQGHSLTLKPAVYGSLAGVLIVVALLGFVVGMQYQKGKTPTNTATATAARARYGAQGGFGGRMGARAGGFGTVTAVSSSSITITEQSFGPNASSDGTSKTYGITSDTTVEDNGSTASASDIKVGDTVSVRTASSTSTVATEIRVNDGMAAPDSQSSGSSTTTTTTNGTSI